MYIFWRHNFLSWVLTGDHCKTTELYFSKQKFITQWCERILKRVFWLHRSAFLYCPRAIFAVFFQWFWPLIPECFAWTVKMKESGVLVLSLGVFEILPWTEDAWTCSRPAKGVRSWLHSKGTILLWKHYFKAETRNSLFLRRLWQTDRDCFGKKREVVMVAHPQAHMKTAFSIIVTFLKMFLNRVSAQLAEKPRT